MGAPEKSAASWSEPSTSIEMSREQTRAARAFLGLSQLALASMAGVQRRVLIDFENGLSIPHRRTAAAIRTVLEEAGIRFVRTADGVGVVLTRSGIERLRDGARGGPDE